MRVVLDASAVMAVLLDEPGSTVVEEALDHAALGAVNLSEVAAALVKNGNSVVQARALIAALGLETVPADHEMALDAGSLRQITDRAGLSLADRFCLALGRRLSAPVLTADRAWATVAQIVDVDVRVIR